MELVTILQNSKIGDLIPVNADIITGLRLRRAK
jgi:hypothetical protein